MGTNQRDYRYHEATLSLCPECRQRIPAKLVIRNDSVYLRRHCPSHGETEVLFEADARFHLAKRSYDKPGTASVTQTPVVKGCPFDCGLCPEHDQHTCIGLIEITQRCDMNCPVCFANGGGGGLLDLEQIGRMLDFYQSAEGGRGEILQISGGEPTTHPEILEMIRLAKAKQFKYIMLNTNGLRIARDPEFVQALVEFRPGFEIYLQFDGWEEQTYRKLRGQNLLNEKLAAIRNLQEHNIPLTLVATVEQGINERELGRLIHFGLTETGVRGINIQPVAYFGRTLPCPEERLTLTGVLQQIEKQMKGMLRVDEFIPLPCNVERVALTYLLKTGSEFLPITRNADVRQYLSLIDNTFAFKLDDLLVRLKSNLFQAEYCCECMRFLHDFKKLIPKGFNVQAPDAIENTFRISVTSFVDANNFDLKSMQKECVHIITPDLRRIPFSAYNLLYREEP